MRRFLWGIVIAAAGIGIYLLWYTLPQSVSLETMGVKYQLGASDRQQDQSVSIAIKGLLKKSLTGRKEFTGTFDLQGEILPIPEGSRELTFSLDGRHGSPMVYFYNDNNRQNRTYGLGVLYADDDFHKFTILFTSSPEGWNANNGTMISAPASSREEALQVANVLMREYLKGLTLK